MDFWYVLNTRIVSTALLAFSDSLPLVALKYIVHVNSFSSQPETNHVFFLKLFICFENFYGASCIFFIFAVKPCQALLARAWYKRVLNSGLQVFDAQKIGEM